jgi:hypothetical protein
LQACDSSNLYCFTAGASRYDPALEVDYLWMLHQGERAPLHGIRSKSRVIISIK